LTTITRTPNKIKQYSNPNQREFSHLEAIKVNKASTYAISKKLIDGKNGQYTSPSMLEITDFKINIPKNTLVKKIQVHYRVGKKGVCYDLNGKNPQPCEVKNAQLKKYADYPNFKNAEVYLNNGGASVKNAKHQTFSIPKNIDSKHSTLTWKGEWEASEIDNLKLTVKFPKNSSKNAGYVIVYYFYISIEYVTPSYTYSIQGVNKDKVYNKEEYHLKISCADKNGTHKGSAVLNLNLPLGFTYKKIAGLSYGKVTEINNRTISWKPNMGSNSASVELVFETNVTFSGAKTHDNFNFTLALQGTSTTKTHTATIYKELPPSNIDNSSDIQGFTDDDSSLDVAKPVWATLNEAFMLLLEFTEEEQEKYSDENEDMPVSFRAYDDEGTAATTWYYSNADNETLSQLSNSAWVIMDQDNSYTFNNYFKVITTPGAYTLQAYGSIDGDLTAGRTEELIRELTIYIKPQESTLTIPSLTILGLTQEELNRLAPTISYTVQSDMKLETEETYVRDWYKNFRIGVFNNPILSNVSSYMQYDNTDTSFDGYFVIPTLYDLTDTTLTIETDKGVILNINETEYTVTDSVTINMGEDYQVPVTFTRNGYDNVILTITLADDEETELYSIDYHINFNSETDTDLHEVTVDNTDYSNLTMNQIFTNAEYWGATLLNVNTVESVTTEFTYNEKYPLYIIVTADYPEGDIDDNTILFNEPCLVESSQFQSRQTNGLYPVPINSLLDNTEDQSSVTITPANNTETLVLSELPLEDNYGTNTERAIRGIEVTGEIEQSDRLVIYAKLKSPTGESRERSIIINDTEDTTDQTTFTIGGNGDLWGFSTLDFVNLEDWELELTISNNLEDTDTTISFGEIELILYVEEVDQQIIKCYINGEDISYYGAFITDVEIPEGLETDTDYLKVDGTDTNDAYRQNIKEKTITLSIDIGDGCSLETSTLSLREFAKLLVNDRDEYNRPIPKTIEFSHYPDVYWEYIMEETFETNLDINTYEIKAKLTIPAGTSYDKTETTTSSMGYVNGLAAINPTVIVKPTDTTISILETISDQAFHIGYTGGWEDKILEIDCEDRIVWLKSDEDDEDPINLNKYVDFNSDWFSIKGEFAFTGVNCVIRTVDYQERW